MPEKEETRIAARPASPNPAERNGPGVRPYELDPELAQIKLAELMIGRLGTPSIVSKPFVVRYGVFHALNHVPAEYNTSTGALIRQGNNTGYDCSLRLHVYREVAAQSVNVDGAYFHDFWAYLMKPKYILNGMAGLPNQFNEEKGESIFGRVVNWFKGGKKDDQRNNP